jgi:hypothetical protein
VRARPLLFSVTLPSVPQNSKREIRSCDLLVEWWWVTPLVGSSRRSPVESSFAVESLLPLHSATAGARMTSMLAVPGRGLGWLTKGRKLAFGPS